MSTHTLELSKDASEQLDQLANGAHLSSSVLLQQKAERWLAWERDALAAHREGLRQIEEGRSYSSEEVRAKLDAIIRSRHAA